MKIRHIVINGLLVVFIITAIFGAVLWFMNSPGTEHRNASYFTIHSAEALRSIAARLEQEGFIRSAFLLELWGRFHATTTSFQKGEYLIPPGISMTDIHDLLIVGNTIAVRVTIPEGYTMRKIAIRMEEYGITSKDSFIHAASDGTILQEYGIAADTVEGFLYPDTYLFPRDYPAEKVVQYMVQTFFIKLEQIIQENERNIPPEILYNTVILASIVEREYVDANEAPLIASVFYNRLDVGMKLQSCATIVYVMTEEEMLEHPTRLLYSDLKKPSRYNTYLHKGLPPTPISNPGYVALNAAFHPQSSDYWFFVLKGQNAKKHYFSRSLEEHYEASFFYLKTSS